MDCPVADTGCDAGEETAWLYWEAEESGGHGFSGVDSTRLYSLEAATWDLFDPLRQLLGLQTGS